MNMVTGTIEGYWDRVRPHAEAAGTEARAHVERIVAHLGQIRDAVQQDESTYIRRRYEVSAVGPTTGPYSVGIGTGDTVPAGEEWTLETITWDAPVATVIRLWADERIRYIRDGLRGTDEGRGLHFPAGARITLSSSVDNTSAYVQFRVERKLPRHNSRHAGQLELGTSPTLDARQDAMGRHGTPGVSAGHNPIGA